MARITQYSPRSITQLAADLTGLSLRGREVERIGKDGHLSGDAIRVYASVCKLSYDEAKRRCIKHSKPDPNDLKQRSKKRKATPQDCREHAKRLRKAFRLRRPIAEVR